MVFTPRNYYSSVVNEYAIIRPLIFGLLPVFRVPRFMFPGTFWVMPMRSRALFYILANNEPDFPLES